ncbi:hypothetical protein C922_03244 [Plasmodium inui San Antonio 1]|uniref:Uncharacterized protein n=1 Tax=Plasmodium inui San Antonio 1 TaxID=1237626 RepID=W7A4U9_9APIC|nr:hypothetical protein C922_03244 [Plasmodium inui San Antonio 1]EUD66328.1 hypothetical protein C922_03244 [Plasmodium inui San Antonio 1]
MKLNSQGDDTKGTDVLWESLYNDFNEITKTNKRHCNYIENSLYNFCKGVSSPDNLSSNLKNRSNEWLLLNHSKGTTGAVPAVGEDNKRSRDSPKGREAGVGSSRWSNLAIQAYLNKNDKQEEEEQFANKNNDPEGVNHPMLQDDQKSDRLWRRHSSFQPGSDYYDGQYVRNKFLDVDIDYLKNETYISCNDVVNSEKTRHSEFQNNNSGNALLREEKRSASGENRGVGTQVGGELSSQLSGHVGAQFDAPFRKGSMFNLMKYNAALKGLGIDGGMSLHNGSSIGSSSHTHKDVNKGVSAFFTSDQQHYENVKSGRLHLTDPKGLFSKREDYTYLLSNKKIYDNVSVGGREMERGHTGDLLGFAPLDSHRGESGNGARSALGSGSASNRLFHNMNKYRNFTVKSDESLTCPSFSYHRAALEGGLIGGNNTKADMQKLGADGANDEYHYDERGSAHMGSTNQRRHEGNRTSCNSLEKLDQLLKSKCRYVSNSRLSELDSLFKKKNKANSEHLRKSFISCDNYKIDSVVSETLNRNTEMDKSESPPSEQMDEVNHNQLIRRSKRLNEISRKCLSGYSDVDPYDLNELYERIDKRKHGTSVAGRSYSNVLDEGECGSVLSAQRVIGKEAALGKNYGLAYNYANGELEEVLCNYVGIIRGNSEGKDSKGKTAEEQNSKSVSKLFEAYDKDKISDVNAPVVSTVARDNPEVNSSHGNRKMNKKSNPGHSDDVVGSATRKKGGHSSGSFCSNGQPNEERHFGKNETDGRVPNVGLNLPICDNYDAQKGTQGKKKKKKNKSTLGSLAENSEELLPPGGDSKGDQEGSSPNAGFKLASIKFPGDEEEEDSPFGGDANKSATDKDELHGKVKNDVYSYEVEEEEEQLGGNNKIPPHGEDNITEDVERGSHPKGGDAPERDNNSVITSSSSARNFIKHPDFEKMYYNQKKEKVPYAEERKISDSQQKALEQCYDNINHANDVKRLFREKNFLQDLCEKRKVIIQKSKIENTKLNVEIKSLLSFNNNLSYALKEKEAEIKMLKKQKEELEMNLMKRINNNGSTQYSLLSNFTSFPTLCRNERSSGVQSDSGACHLLRNRSSCTILNNIADASASVSSGGGNQSALIQSYEEKIQELLVQVKMYQTKNSDLQEQLRIFMNE